jgi:hypothetical protein
MNSLLQSGSSRKFAQWLLSAMLIASAASADELLRDGTWDGAYQPPEWGEKIDAEFKVEKQISGAKTKWKISMSLDLDSPSNRTVEFMDIEPNADQLRFMMDMNPPLECRLDAGSHGKLSGRCYAETWGEGSSAKMTMKPPPASTVKAENKEEIDHENEGGE